LELKEAAKKRFEEVFNGNYTKEEYKLFEKTFLDFCTSKNINPLLEKYFPRNPNI
jgi:hypothetical protein